MIVKQLVDEDFVNYKKPSMFVAFPFCTFKCEKECGLRVCQNSTLAKTPNIKINTDELVERYLNNPVTSAIVMGGLEPIDSWEDLKEFIIKLRLKTDDDIVIYTGYKAIEIDYVINWLNQFPNIIIKFDRYIPNQQPHFDDILGVELASDNQYARRITS